MPGQFRSGDTPGSRTIDACGLTKPVVQAKRPWQLATRHSHLSYQHAPHGVVAFRVEVQS
ncbi:MAG: hypothetical protein M3Q69_07775 [Acidobacteriota bacterium]|nr:hypothetical protein [Acidobacteriota bacterium]